MIILIVMFWKLVYYGRSSLGSLRRARRRSVDWKHEHSFRRQQNALFS